MTDRAFRNIVALTGLAVLLIGLAAYDWRVACVVGGGTLFGAGVLGMYVAARAALPLTRNRVKRKD